MKETVKTGGTGKTVFATVEWPVSIVSTVWLFLSACAPTPPVPAPRGPLVGLEASYQSLRYWDDQRRLLSSLGVAVTPAGVAQSVVQDSLNRAREQFLNTLRDPSTVAKTPSDSRARATMVQAWRTGLSADQSPTDIGGSASGSCSYDPAVVGTGPDGLQRLTARIYQCYGAAAGRIVVDGDTLNRLAVLGKLARLSDPVDRHSLFLTLQPVWRSVNGDGGPRSPYRTLLALRMKAWGSAGSPVEQKAPAFGLTSVQMERWLAGALGQWRDAMPDSLIEPWDWYYFAGEATRKLSPKIPLVDDLRRVNDQFYRSIGAPPDSLGIHYDLLPRQGKDPVAYTDFGSRNGWVRNRLTQGEPWIFTAYVEGGFDNLAELLHETGHGIHIAGIQTRPAYIDWPDNDTFTEALADIAALEIYEPAWQQRFLGDSASLASSLRAKYAGIVLDMAWALFEIQVHRKPEVDPNRLWSDITSEYLGIVPHPELSWWAMRGQLIDAPGYLVNYALGAFITADLRASAARKGHSFALGGVTQYPWLVSQLYRFGQERTSREVLERFVGGPVRPDPLLADLRRMASGRKGAHR